MSESPAPAVRQKPLPPPGVSRALPKPPTRDSRGTEVGRGRGRGRSTSRSPRPEEDLGASSSRVSSEVEESSSAVDETSNDVSEDIRSSSPPSSRSPPTVRTWSRTTQGQDRPVSGDLGESKGKVVSPRSNSLLAARHKSGPGRPVVTAPNSSETTPILSRGTGKLSVIPTSQRSEEQTTLRVSSETTLRVSAETAVDSLKDSNPRIMRLSDHTLQRLSARLSQNDLRKRNDTMRSLDTRIKEALLADDGSDGQTDAGESQGEPEPQQVETNDQVWVWGNRGLDVISYPTPQQMPELGSKNVKQVCAGYQHTIMVLENGAVYSWGVGSDGRLGHGKNDANQLLPTKVEALAMHNVKMVSAGGSCSVAVTHEGVCYFFGWLGVEEAMHFVTPAVVEGLEKQRVISAACGENHILILSHEHLVSSWGLNKYGSLGQGRKEMEFVATPKPVMPNQESIACGPFSGACISTKGQLSYWGPNLVKKKDKPYKKPEKITHKNRVVSVALGAQHMLLLEENGDIYAFGEGADGQLGTGYYTPQAEPTKVEFPLSREEKLRLRGIGAGRGAPGASSTVRPSIPSGGADTPTPTAPKGRGFGKAAAPPQTAALSSSLRDTTAAPAPAPKQIKAIGAGNASSVAVTKEGMVFVWGKIDSKGTESFLQPTLVRVLDKIAIDQVSVNCDQIVALVGLKNEKDIRFFSFNPPIVKAATLGKLVDWLLSEKVQQDPLFLYSFFASHDVFSSSIDVIEELSARYERARSTDGSKLHTRLLAVLMQWIKLRPLDFRAPVTKKRMEEFLNKMEPAPQRQIRKCIETEENATQAPNPFLTLSYKSSIPPAFGKYGALEVAQQLALVDKTFFDRIKPAPELTHQNWMKTAKRDLSPNVLAFIARFNQLFYVIVTDCIAHDQTNMRSARFTFWADVHQHSVSIGNLNAAVCVASALNSVPIRKLAKRELIVIKPQQRQSLEDFRKLLSDRNKTGYREMLQKKIDDGEPAIPYLATMLSDLTFIEEGNKNTLADGLIHFYKFHLIGKQLQTVDELSKRSYHQFQPDEAMQALLAGSVGLDEDMCDKVADAICAGTPIAPLLSGAEAKRSALEGASESGGGGAVSDKVDNLVESLDAEAASLRDGGGSSSRRLDVWNSWLTRCDREGDEFRAVLCSSTALAESVDAVLIEALKKPELPVFQSILGKLLSTTSNARSLMSLLSTVVPVTSVFSDVREEVVRLCVSQEFNALAEIAGQNTIKGEPMGFFELAEEERIRQEKRKELTLLDGVDFEKLDTAVFAVGEGLTSLMMLPAVKSTCEYDPAPLQEVVATREAQVQERIASLEDAGNTDENNVASGDEDHMLALSEKMALLKEREKELEEALMLVRQEMEETAREIAGTEAKMREERKRTDSSGAQREELLRKERAMNETIATVATAIKGYLEKSHAPRQARLVARLEKGRESARQKLKAFVALFEELREGLQACVVSGDTASQSPWDLLDDTKRIATRGELKVLVDTAYASLLKIENVFRSIDLEPDLMDHLSALVEECLELSIMPSPEEHDEQ